MKLLAIDTSLASCSAALLDDATGRILAAERLLMERGHAEALAPMIGRIMHRAELGFDDLGRIAVTTGPGTFTGIRIGVATVQGLGLATKIPITGLDTMQATAAPAFGQNRQILVAHTAGATGLAYVQGFRADGSATGPVLLQVPGSIDVPDDCLVIGTAAVAVTGGARNASLDLPDASRFAAFAATLPYSRGMPEPFYIRGADAKPQTTASDIAISIATTDDAGILAALHAQCFDEPWRVDELAAMLAQPGLSALISRGPQGPAGFILARTVVDESEILTLCTLPGERRRGHALALVGRLQSMVTMLGSTALHLEVAEDNVAALSLYQRQGFSYSGRRRGYYQRRHGRTDALMLKRKLP